MIMMSFKMQLRTHFGSNGIRKEELEEAHRPASVQQDNRGPQRQAYVWSRDWPTEWHHCRQSGTEREEDWRERIRRQASAAIWTPGLHQLLWNGGIWCCRGVQPSCILLHCECTEFMRIVTIFFLWIWFLHSTTWHTGPFSSPIYL